MNRQNNPICENRCTVKCVFKLFFLTINGLGHTLHDPNIFDWGWFYSLEQLYMVTNIRIRVGLADAGKGLIWIVYGIHTVSTPFIPMSSHTHLSTSQLYLATVQECLNLMRNPGQCMVSLIGIFVLENPFYGKQE